MAEESLPETSACEHDWRPCGYVLSYQPGGRRYTMICALCGAEGDREELDPAFSNRVQATLDRHEASVTNTHLIVLNDDTIVCDACYEPQAVEINAGRVPFARTSEGECACCGATSIWGRLGPVRSDA